MAERDTGDRPESERVRVSRTPANARYRRDTVHAFLDRHVLAHVGFSAESGPCVLPMLYARFGDELYLHGSRVSRLIENLADGVDACVSVAQVDGFVFSRSAFDSSVNYRSVVAFGRCTPVADETDKLYRLMAMAEALMPGRTAHVRPPARKELAATELLRFRIDEASAKCRQGPPDDQAADLASDLWAGVVPVTTHFGEPEPDPAQPAERPLPPHIREFAQRCGLFAPPGGED